MNNKFDPLDVVLDGWSEEINEDVENGDYDDTIFSQSQSRNLEYVTTNIGGSDSFGTDETRLGYSSWNKIGIIELSTKAVKYLSRSMRKRNDEFQFDDFYRKGELTLTGYLKTKDQDVVAMPKPR